jgi:hypothetical protein
MALSAPICREEGSLQGVGEVVLYHQRWLSETAPFGAVIVLHGIGNHGGRYADLAEALASSGYAVHALDQRGHGRSQGPRVYVERFADLIDDVDAFFSIAETIAFLSQLMTPEPGDIIATGTPAGVGYTRTPSVSLRDGDVVEVEIQGIGTLRNTVRVEQAPARRTALVSLERRGQ